MAVQLSGDQFHLSAGPFAATVTSVGAGLRELTFAGRRVIEGYGADEVCPGARGQLLVPWPNRVDRGRYTFDGSDHQLDVSEPDRDCAIHGLVRWGTWSAAHHSHDRLALTNRLHGRPGYPHVLDVEVTYALDADAGLTVTLRAFNAGTTTAPYGNGAHPYLTAGAASIDDCEVTIPAATWIATDDRGIPTDTRSVTDDDGRYDFREARKLGTTAMDYAFGALQRDHAGRAWVVLRDPASGASSALWVAESYPYVEVFTGDHLPDADRRREALGVEPMTCPPNAFVTGTDVITLAPGAEHVSSWGITAT